MGRLTEEIHKPVLLDELIELLDPQPTGVYVDATVGDGGHAGAVCARLSREGKLIGIDRDVESLRRAWNNLKDYEGRFLLEKGNFGSLESIVRKTGHEKVDGIILDLGISSNQVDQPGRGFSYHKDGPLDMRMDREMPETAADLVRMSSEHELTRIFRDYGEERWASRIASFITEYQKQQEIKTTAELVRIVKSAVPAGARQKGAHPARRCFQALRIAINKELKELEEVLPQCVRLLGEGGKICVISYHSLEDRLVKNYFRNKSETCCCPPGMPECICKKEPGLHLVTRRPLRPSKDEILSNPRSRSARLRVAIRVLNEEEGE